MYRNEVLVRRDGSLGRIILNRPKALNALTHGMVTAIAAALKDWIEDETVRTVMLSGAGERGLCAGGDIVAIYRDALQGGTETASFWADEYRLNALIASYPKPIVALMDGIVLGGGVGVSAHASIRVVTERTKLGMPEVGIGFIPDVGGTWLLSHAPGERGTHMALTAGTVSGPDAIACGLADHFVDAGDLPMLSHALSQSDAHEAVRSIERSWFPASDLAASAAWIDSCYAFDRAEEIVEALLGSDVPAAREAAERIQTKSPTALKVTLASLRRARGMDSLEAVLDQEYRVSLRALVSADFTEGIRAQVIEKDRTPSWSTPRLEHVTPHDVEQYFADLGPRELGLSRQLEMRS